MKITFESIFVFLMILMPICDSLNGYFIYKYNMSVLGPIYRSIIFIYCIFCFFYKNKLSKINKVLWIVIYFIIFSSVFSIEFGLKGIEYNFNKIVKIIFPILIIESYRNLNVKGLIKYNSIIVILERYSWLFPITIIPLFITKSGLNVYGNGSGFKGFYNSNNELNIIFLVLFIYNMDKVFNQGIKVSIRNLIYIILNFICLILIGSKTSIISVAVIVGIYIMKNIKKIKLGSIMLIIVTGIAIGLFMYKNYAYQLALIVERQKYFYKIYEHNIMNFIFSSRNIFLQCGFEILKNSNNILEKILFGFSPYDFVSRLGSKFNTVTKIIEMDIADIFFFYGVIGSIFIWRYYFRIIKCSLRKYKLNMIEYSFYLNYILIIIFSILAGHVVFATLSGTICALVCCRIIDVN